MGQLKEARPLYEEALQARRKSSGPSVMATKRSLVDKSSDETRARVNAVRLQYDMGHCSRGHAHLHHPGPCPRKVGEIRTRRSCAQTAERESPSTPFLIVADGRHVDDGADQAARSLWAPDCDRTR